MNYVFTQHFQNLAQGHFTIRRLERVYGHETVRRAYERLAGHAHAAAPEARTNLAVLR